MTKKELEFIESIIEEMDESDECIEVLERLYFEVKHWYEDQCEKKLGHKPKMKQP